MNYFSLNQKSPQVSFADAVINGLAPDRGLYFPETIPVLDKNIIGNIKNTPKEEIAFEVIKNFVGDEIPEIELRQIVAETVAFNFPLIGLEEHVFSLELYHGPTMAFKDVGARFMARCLAYFNRNSSQEVTVLVATSGDTGGAVANGFLGVKGVKVVILYPSGKVSEIQEKQLTTLGQNISALEVEGSFDDCQEMVKTAFLDTDITQKRKLTSANSINVARWLPQMFYFFFAYQNLIQKGRNEKLIFSVPSGNFGNIAAGMMAKNLGLPIAHFIAATNVNNTVPRYLKDGHYAPHKTIPTISNAMDVSDPSNFVRIQKMHHNDIDLLRSQVSGCTFSDKETLQALRDLKSKYNYIADPHGAVAWLGLEKYLKKYPAHLGIFLETAHPVKFLDVVQPLMKESLTIPSQIQQVMGGQKVATTISNYEEFKAFLM